MASSSLLSKMKGQIQDLKSKTPVSEPGSRGELPDTLTEAHLLVVLVGGCYIWFEYAMSPRDSHVKGWSSTGGIILPKILEMS